MSCGCAKITPKLTVITTCFNDGEFLPEALGSLAAQTFQAWEHVIVNNGSTDDTASVAAAWATRPQRVRVLTLRETVVQPEALNRGAALARAPWWVLLNADDLLQPGALATIQSIAEARPQVNVIHSPLEYFGAVRTTYEPKAYNPARIVDEHQINGVRAVRRDLWERTGGEDASIAVGADWDWSVRASLAGMVPYYFPTALWRCRKFDDRVRLTDQGDVPALQARMRQHLQQGAA